MSATKKKPKKEQDLCAGCYHNGYNHGLGGAKKCWSFKTAKVIKRLSIPSQKPPPYNKDNWTWMLSCFNQSQMCYPSPDSINSEGYWRN